MRAGKDGEQVGRPLQILELAGGAQRRARA